MTSIETDKSHPVMHLATLARDAQSLQNHIADIRSFSEAINHARSISQSIEHAFSSTILKDTHAASEILTAFACCQGIMSALESVNESTKTKEVERILVHAYRDSCKLTSHVEQASYRILTQPTVNVARSAQTLADATLLLLPPRNRERYSEEFRSELYDLAQAKATQSMQILYAIQQLTRVWQLRGALRNPSFNRVELLRQAACWVLSSQARTWGLIGIVTIAALLDIVVQQGPGSAFFAIPTLAGFHVGVEWLRKHWNVTVRGRKTSEDE